MWGGGHGAEGGLAGGDRVERAPARAAMGAPPAPSTLSTVPARIYVETGSKKVFVSAADWPGWCRGAKNEVGALQALADYAPRYAKIAKLARLDFPKDPTSFHVVERLKGDATTDFGAPGAEAKEEPGFLPKELERLASLVDACWKYLDQVRAKAPESLRKGPRGGGRDREKMYAHVLESEMSYARYLGLRLKEPDRDAMRKAFRKPMPDTKRSAAYIMRRTAWHAMDHAWEMEDRIP